MGIGSSIRDVGGAVLVYRSDDLMNWTYLHPLVTGRIDPSDPLCGGTGCECPDFFQTGDGDWVLMVSGWDQHPVNVVWMTGSYADTRSAVHGRGLVDAGPSFYAPQSFTDDEGRRVMFGWLMERRTVDAQVADGWSGAMTLPRVVSVGTDGTLVSAPAPENAALRTAPIVVTVAADGSTDLQGHTIELVARFRADGEGPVGLNLRQDATGPEVTTIRWEAGELVLDTTRSSTDPAVTGTRSTLAASSDGELQLRVYLDRSVIEVAHNDARWVSDRVYPVSASAVGVSVIRAERLISLEAWAMGEAFTPE
jgi:beta-fructofuranosidase